MKIATLVAVSLCALAGTVVAQSQPTPGAPSQPFSALAQAQNGGAGPQVTYQYGMEFVTVPGGSQVYPGGSPNDLPGLSPGVGRGAVAEDFRIGRHEVGRASWNAFFSAAEQVRAATGQAIPWLSPAGGLSGGGQYGRTGNISWRTAAIYCNWLHNDQAVTRDAFMSGAYDVSTFTFGNGGFNDQLTHSAGARFFIPSMDQWMRAGFFDPNHNSAQYGNWWQYGHASDTAAWPGLPRQFGEANYGFVTGTGEEFTVPLGAYGQIQSPWGLFDVSGASTEWIEEPFYLFGGPGTALPTGRIHAGTYLTSSPGAIFTTVGGIGGQSDSLDDAYWMGFRIAATIPAPGGGILLSLSGMLMLRQRRGASRSVEYSVRVLR